jgi:hypothetical protein
MCKTGEKGTERRRAATGKFVGTPRRGCTLKDPSTAVMTAPAPPGPQHTAVSSATESNEEHRLFRVVAGAQRPKRHFELIAEAMLSVLSVMLRTRNVP